MMARSVDREVLEELRERIEELERELALLKKLYSILSGSVGVPTVNERVVEVKAGRKRIAWLYSGEDYVRLVPEFTMAVDDGLKEYLEEAVEEIRARQSREGVEEEEQAQLIILNDGDGAVEEIWIKNIEGIADTIRAKTALEYIAELAWDQFKEKVKRGEGVK